MLIILAEMETIQDQTKTAKDNSQMEAMDLVTVIVMEVASLEMGVLTILKMVLQVQEMALAKEDLTDQDMENLLAKAVINMEVQTEEEES